MSRFHRPENALKRADELILVGQKMNALQHLHDVITNKRLRTWTPALEQIMLKYVELCVDLKYRMTKEGLYQYKNVTQNSNPQSLEKVVQHFLALAEARVGSAQEAAEKIVVDVDDLEESETPESMMLSLVTGEDQKDRTDRGLVMPSIRFLWETYRTVVDVLRNNAKLEALYQQTAQQAFAFCLKYNRKMELRRLCEMLRMHLQYATKSSQQHAINLSNPESLQLHLDTRFVQLNATVELELWQEAFRSVEDLHGLMNLAKKKMLKPASLANYYEKLTEVFLVADNGLFHAYAYKQFFYTLKSMNKITSNEERTTLASAVLLSALAVPVLSTPRMGISGSSYAEQEESKSRQDRLANLLFVHKRPTRDLLLRELLSKDVVQQALPEVAELYRLLEVDFQPLSLASKLAPILEFIEKEPKFARYSKAVRQVALARLMQQLSQVYKSLKMSSVIALAPFATPLEVEKFIADACKRGDLSVRINHLTQSITFNAAANLSGDREEAVVAPTEVRSQLVVVSRRLTEAERLVNPLAPEVAAKARSLFFQRFAEEAAAAHEAAIARKNLIERKKEEAERRALLKEREEWREKQRQAAIDAENERQRLAEETRRREQERLQREREEIEREQRMRVVEEMKRKGEAAGIKLDLEDLKDLAPDELVKKQVQIFETEKKEMKARLTSLARRMDHLERAFRKEEQPLLVEDYEHQKKEDRRLYDEMVQSTLKTARDAYERDAQLKQSMAHVLGDAKAYQERVLAARRADFERRQAEVVRKVEAEVQRRREERERIAEERRRQEEEERERRRQEEEERERRRHEEEERRAALEAQERARREQQSAGWRSEAAPARSTEPKPLTSPEVDRFLLAVQLVAKWSATLDPSLDAKDLRDQLIYEFDAREKKEDERCRACKRPLSSHDVRACTRHIRSVTGIAPPTVDDIEDVVIAAFPYVLNYVKERCYAPAVVDRYVENVVDEKGNERATDTAAFKALLQLRNIVSELDTLMKSRRMTTAKLTHQLYNRIKNLYLLRPAAIPEFATLIEKGTMSNGKLDLAAVEEARRAADSEQSDVNPQRKLAWNRFEREAEKKGIIDMPQKRAYIVDAFRQIYGFQQLADLQQVFPDAHGQYTGTLDMARQLIEETKQRARIPFEATVNDVRALLTRFPSVVKLLEVLPEAGGDKYVDVPGRAEYVRLLSIALADEEDDEE